MRLVARSPITIAGTIGAPGMAAQIIRRLPGNSHIHLIHLTSTHRTCHQVHGRSKRTDIAEHFTFQMTTCMVLDPGQVNPERFSMSASSISLLTTTRVNCAFFAPERINLLSGPSEAPKLTVLSPNRLLAVVAINGGPGADSSSANFSLWRDRNRSCPFSRYD